MLHVDLSVPVHHHGHQVLRADVAQGSVLALFGPSGSGKTTLIRAMLGLHAAEGTLSWNGDRLDGRPIHNRPFAWVPQDPSLFPHWTLRRQIEEARAGRVDEARIREIVQALGLEGLQERAARALSGGQQQRGELARALARDPDVLLLDEPFSALDGPTRREIGGWLTEQLRGDGMAMVLASHDWSDVEAWADEVCLMDQGRVVAQGQPGELFRHPPSWTAARLVGYETRVGKHALHPDLADFQDPRGRPVVVSGEVLASKSHGAGFRLTLRTDTGSEVSATGPRDLPRPPLGSRVEVGFQAPEVGDE